MAIPNSSNSSTTKNNRQIAGPRGRLKWWESRKDDGDCHAHQEWPVCLGCRQPYGEVAVMRLVIIWYSLFHPLNVWYDKNKKVRSFVRTQTLLLFSCVYASCSADIHIRTMLQIHRFSQFYHSTRTLLYVTSHWSTILLCTVLYPIPDNSFLHYKTLHVIILGFSSGYLT